MSILQNLSQIKGILEAYPRAKLLVVTKGRSVEQIQEILGTGVQEIGENRVQEIEEKVVLLPTSVTIHLIGHLQTNKVKKAVKYSSVIQSIDSFRLAEKVDAECARQQKILPVFLQVNISKEEQKCGFLPDEVLNMYTKIDQLNHIKIQGLMCLPKYSPDAEKSRIYFQKMQLLYTNIIQKYDLNPLSFELSMGTSHDYHVALEEGSTLIRVGSAIFE